MNTGESNGIRVGVLIVGAVVGAACWAVVAQDRVASEKVQSVWRRPADWEKVAGDLEGLDRYRCPRPEEFAFVYSAGWVRDPLPKEDAKFEQLVVKIKECGYNVVHCIYSDRRLELCRKHGVKMMVDLLEYDRHVFQTPKAAEALCRKLEGDPAVWGYCIWNEAISKYAQGRIRDIRNVRRWDPSHPAYMGTYMTDGIEGITNGDVISYYDYHWNRGVRMHLEHLKFYRDLMAKGDSRLYSLYRTGAGWAGEENFRRNLWSVNTGIAFGLKGVMWFLSDAVVDPQTLADGTYREDIRKIHQAILPMRRELMKIGNPTAVYGTMVTRHMNNKPAGPDGKPIQCPATAAVPADFWAQPKAGEFMMGVFKDDRQKDVLYLANYNAVAPQAVKIALAPGCKVSLFDRPSGQWKAVPIADGLAAFPLEPGGGQMLRRE